MNEGALKGSRRCKSKRAQKRRHKGTGPLSTFATHGQLKEVARHFFDRLQAELYYPTGQPYPWDAPVAQPVADYAVANLGQIKSLFQFDLATDSDKDGIPDWWEKAHGLNHKNRNDALATSAGGRMTNLAAYRNHLDPADASAPVASSLAPSDPPVVITLRSSRLDNSTTDSSSAFIGLKPGSPPLIKNGDFEEEEPNPPSPPSSGEFIGDLRKWHVGEPSPAKLAWRAIGGEKAVSPTDPNIPGERANYLQWETQQQIADYTLPSRYGSAKTGKLNSYAELDAHWERKDANGTPIRGNTATDKKDAGKSDPSTESDHGIKQTVSLSRGNYLLLFDYRGRVGSDSNQFKVSAKGERAVDVETDLIAEKNAIDPITGESPTGLQKWKQGSVSFSVSGGNPADTAALPVILKFDLVLAPGKKADSFGVFIDNVILLPVELNCPELYMFSGHSGDKVELCKVAGIACEWKLKNANPVIGTFDHPTDSACSFTATAPGKNTIQLVVGGKVAWEKTTEILDLKSRATWGPEAVVLSEMSGVMRAPPTPPGTGTPITQIFNLTYHHSANAGDGVTEIQRIQRAHKAEGLP